MEPQLEKNYAPTETLLLSERGYGNRMMGCRVWTCNSQLGLFPYFITVMQTYYNAAHNGELFAPGVSFAYGYDKKSLCLIVKCHT